MLFDKDVAVAKSAPARRGKERKPDLRHDTGVALPAKDWLQHAL